MYWQLPRCDVAMSICERLALPVQCDHCPNFPPLGGSGAIQVSWHVEAGAYQHELAHFASDRPHAMKKHTPFLNRHAQAVSMRNSPVA